MARSRRSGVGRRAKLSRPRGEARKKNGKKASDRKQATRKKKKEKKGLVRCLSCNRKKISWNSIRSLPICETCRKEENRLAWKVVYDRDTGVGSIPANLLDRQG